MLHEAIPITGTITSGTYNPDGTTEENIKNYSHGMFQSVYDYPYLSSSANHIFDITCGYHSTSSYNKSTNNQNSKKVYHSITDLIGSVNNPTPIIILSDRINPFPNFTIGVKYVNKIKKV